jgi:hypothetical protein
MSKKPKQASHSSITSNKQPEGSIFNSYRTLYFLLGLIIVLCTISVVKEFYPHRPPAQSTSPEPNQESVVITGPNAFFYTKVFLERDKTFVSFPFKPPSPPQLIWLFLVMQEGTPHTRLLISHPQLNDLEWPSVTNGFVTLYQREKQYETIDDFINNPPASSQTSVLMDPYLTRINPYQEVPATQISEREPYLELDNINYILTTYHPPRIGNDGYHYYETTLDAGLAQLNDSEQLIWQILSPATSETNPLTIGTIHVDYRQF